MMSLRAVHSVYRKNYANSRQILFSIHIGIAHINKETTLMLFRRVLYIICHFVVGTDVLYKVYLCRGNIAERLAYLLANRKITGSIPGLGTLK